MAYRRLGVAWKGAPIPTRHAPVWMMRLLAALAARRDGGYLRDVTAMNALYDSLPETLGDPEPAQRILGFEFLSVEAVGRKLRDDSLDPAMFLP